MASTVSFWSCIFLLSLIVALSAGEDESKEYVLTLDHSNFNETVSKHDFIVVEFYAPWYTLQFNSVCPFLLVLSLFFLNMVHRVCSYGSRFFMLYYVILDLMLDLVICCFYFLNYGFSNGIEVRSCNCKVTFSSCINFDDEVINFF